MAGSAAPLNSSAALLRGLARQSAGEGRAASAGAATSSAARADGGETDGGTSVTCEHHLRVDERAAAVLERVGDRVGVPATQRKGSWV